MDLEQPEADAIDVELVDLHADYLFAAPAGFTSSLQAAMGPSWECYWNPNEQVFDPSMDLEMDEHPDVMLPGDHTPHPPRLQPDRGCWVVYVRTTVQMERWDPMIGVVRYPATKLAPVYRVNGITNFGRPFGLGQWLLDDLRYSDLMRWGDICRNAKTWARREAYLRQWRRESHAMDAVAGDKFINQRLRATFQANGGWTDQSKEFLHSTAARLERVAIQRAKEKQKLLKELGL